MSDVVRMSIAEWRPPWCRYGAEQRPADSPREHIVEVEVQLRDGADAGAARPIDRDDRLDPDLEIIADPDHAGIDRARDHEVDAGLVRNRRRELAFHDWNQVVDEVGQPEIDDARPEIGHAELQCAAPYQVLRNRVA